MNPLLVLYHEVFPGASIRYGNDNRTLLIEDDEDNDYIAYTGNKEEFIDRIERSKKCGRNLFFEECKKIPYKPLPKGVIPD